MITKEKLETLLASPETPILDFKGRMYEGIKRTVGHDYSNPRGTNPASHNGYLDMVKDVLAMANTPRTESAFIVLGIVNKPNSTNQIKGITDEIDDNDIQSHLKRWCEPIPQVHYYTVIYKSILLGVIEILPDRERGPFFVTSKLTADQQNILREQTFLQEKTLYFRRGTTNDFARFSDADYIDKWFKSFDDEHWQSWDRFKRTCYYFNQQRHYILITSSLASFDAQHLSALSNIDWTAIIDFDTASDSNGLLKAFGNVPPRRNIIRVVKGERPPFSPRSSLYWFFGQGIEGRHETLITPPHDWRRWRNVYGSELDHQFTRLAEAITPVSVTFIILWHDSPFLSFLRTAVDATTRFSTANYVFVGSSAKRAANEVGENFEAEVIQISLDDICRGLKSEFSAHDGESREKHLLPSTSGTPIEVPLERETWLADELELVHLGLPSTDSQSGDSQEFLRGAVISWMELNIRKDAERDKTADISRRIRLDLSRRETARVNLYHKPGAGGTTVARRILWDLRREYPCAVLLRTDPDHVEATAERLAYIYEITQLPVLLLVDSAQIADRLIDELFDSVRPKGSPVVMLITSRRVTAQSQGNRSFQLEATLGNSELARFLEQYRAQVPDRTTALSNIIASRETQLKTAFNFGLTAFGKDFYGIEPYVSARLDNLTELQRDIIVYLALAHYYAQRGIPTQAFRELLAVPGQRDVKLERAFDEALTALDLLIQEDGAWRPIHYVISEAVLEIALSPTVNARAFWKQQLSNWAKRFVNFCRGDYEVIGQDSLELVRRTFVYRDNSDPLGRETGNDISSFSRIIQDIPVPEGRQEIFKHLTSIFPEEAHFWAHYGRFLALVMRHYDQALLVNQRAIDLQPDDHVLLHMQGMIYRYQAIEKMEQNESIHEIVSLAEKASLCFADSRDLNPDNEHGYISEVQLLIRILNYAGREANGSVLQYMKQMVIPPYIRSAFDQAESLLAQVRSNREGEAASTYEQQCRAQLHDLYGEPAQALQVWDNLLTRNDVDRPSIRRQIIHTIRNRDGSWENIHPHGRERIIRLLEENLEQDPHSERDLRLWLQAVRYTNTPPSIESLIEKITYWKINTNSLDATYYLYILNTLRAMEGLSLERTQAERYINECNQLARARRNRQKSLEWYGTEEGLKRIVHQSALGNWNDNFWENKHLLERVMGRITKYIGPEAGTIELKGSLGLTAFFVPGKDQRITSADITRPVNFFLGFSYSGLRAWDVRLET